MRGTGRPNLDSGGMDPRDRRRSLLLFAMAAAAWVAFGAVIIFVDPLSSSMAGLGGAAALAIAGGLTTAPMFWLISFARHGQIAFRGDWTRALRRGAWVGALLGVFVVMRVNGIFQPQIGLFLLALALVAEVTLTAGGANRA
jgi:hypothetical protein